MRMSRRDLYALGEPFGSSATQLKAGSKNRTYGGGDSGPSAPTQTTVQNTSLPDYAQPYVMSMLGAAQNQMFQMNPSGQITGFTPYTPYSNNPSNYVAGFSPLQQQAQTGIANLQTPGQFGAATGATAGAMNQLANNTYNPIASNYLSTQAPQLQNYSMQNPGNVGAAQTQAAQLGAVPLAQAAGFQGPANVNAQNVTAQNVSAPNLQNYQMQGPANVSATGITAPTMQAAQTNFNPNLNTYQMGPASNVTTQDFTQGNTAQQFMNPYIKQALDPQLAEISRQYGITGTQEQSAATAAGAFGGSREALMAAENQRNKNTAMNAAIGQGYNTAYQNAQQQFNTQQQANLAAQQANQQAGINVGGQNLAAQLGVQQLGTQSGLQAQLANLSNQQQAAVNNQAAQLQASGMNAQQALQAALANQQSSLTTGQQNLAANLGVQQLGAGQNLQAQQLNQSAGLQAGQLNQAANLQAGLANQNMGYNTNLQNAQLAQQANLANQGILGQYGLQQGQLNQQAGLQNAQLAQQANLANQQNAYNTNAQNLAAQLGIQQLGSGQNLQSQLANQSAYGTANQLAANQQQFGANYGLQNLQALLGGAAQLGNLGTNQLAANQSILNAQNTAGAAQQAQQQQIINQAIQNYAMQQQFPMQSLSNLSALLHGLPLQNTTTQNYQAAPSTVSQIAGLGTGALGASKLLGAKEGGVVKMAGGGIASLENRQRIAENYNPQQIQKEVQNGVLPQGIGGVLSQDYSNLQKAAQGVQAQQALARQQAQQPQTPGVTELPSNLPVQGMAEGGIIAFAKGDKVKDNNADFYLSNPDITDPNYDYKKTKAYQEFLKRGNPALQNPMTPYDQAMAALKEQSTPQPADPASVINQNTMPPSNVTPLDYSKQQGINTALASMNAPPTPPGIQPPPAAPQFSLDALRTGLPNVTKGLKSAQGPTLNKADFMPETPSLEGIQGLRSAAYEKSGVSEKPYENFLADLKSQKDELKAKGKDEALGNFLAQLGFGMAAGKSPYAMQNIGEAGVGATKSLMADLKDLDAKSDKIAERQFAVMDAQNKFRQTGADSDLKTLTDKQNAFSAANRDYYTTNAKLQSDQATRDDAMTHLGVTEAGANARASLSAKLQAQQINISAFSAQTQRMAEQKPELFGTIMDTLGTDQDYLKADGKTKVKMITDAISDTKATSAAAGTKGFTYLKELNAEFSNPLSPVYKEYKRIEKLNGLDAAEAYRTKWTSGKMAEAGVPQPGSTAAASSASTAGWGQMSVK